MTTKTLARLAPVGLLCLLTACSGSPENTPEQTSPPSATAPASPAESTAATAPQSPDPSPSASPEPTVSQSASTDQIPAAIHGRWITFSPGEEPRECTAEVEGEGAIITVDATRISSFAFLFELESIEESDANSMVGQFAYHDDSDQLMTPEIKLVTTDDWKTMEFIELGTEGQEPASYSRCA